MKRRSFLLATAAFVAGLPSISTAQAFGFRNRVTCVVVSDITPETPIEHLLPLFDALAERGLPFTCVVNPFDKTGRALAPEDRLAVLLSGYLMQGRGMDVAAYVPDLGEQSAYSQGRHIRNANAALRSSLTHHRTERAAQAQFRVVACTDVDTPKAPAGVRSAGVNTIIALAQDSAPVSSEDWPNGVVRIYGGARIDVARYSSDQLQVDPSVTQALYHISSVDLEQKSPEAISAFAAAFAEDLLTSESSGQNTVQLVSDLQLRDDYGFKRYFAVHLTRPAKGNEAQLTGFDAFREGLNSHGIIASVGNATGAFTPDRSTDYWVPVTNSPGTRAEDVQLAEVTRACQTGLVTGIAAPKRALAPGHSLALGAVQETTPGFDSCGVLWLPSIDVADQQAVVSLSDKIGHVNDVVISVHPNALTERFARTKLLNQILELASDGVSQVVPVQLLGQLIAPKGAEIERQRRTIAAMPGTRAHRGKLLDASRQALLEDAKIAWSYIDKNTIRSTGLCPATVNFSSTDGRIHPSVTMWDVGSHINGLVAASQLGFIDKRDFEKRISQILTQVRGRTSQGRHLPQGWLRVDRQKWGNRNFDGSDAGRLLASFENLRRYAGMDDRLGELVDSWDLDQIVINGEVHSVTDGKLHSVYRSHSAHYSARAFGYWGVKARSPYDVFRGQSEYDDQMALLEAVSWIGPLGAEPLLLEAMELGMSDESAYLAEVLFAAQLEEYEETGRLIAVSEGPIDRAPWFTYQGLQLDAVERTWALDTVGHEPQYADPQFWRDNLVISSKSAFLWAAYKPHDYSEKLLSYVREKSRTNRGFASSIFNKTGRVTSTYTDLNTNGVILQAIAKTLVEA